ncbi:hypothetical protein LVJ94_51220 [Pendulispora rubella]|uniref:Glycosyl hydrolase n=1 Tax=Pendulispora rubella TaxID=2741070 RepID=A0ABZ2L2X3_9BACT
MLCRFLADSQASYNAITSFWAIDPQHAWMAGYTNVINDRGRLLQYDGTRQDGGSKWKSVELFHAPVPWGVDSLYVAAADDIWIGGLDMLTHWNGTTWTNVAPIKDMYFIDLWGSSKSDIWATADDSPYTAKVRKVFHYDGARWTQASVEGGRIWGTSASAVWIVNANVLQRWDGKAWTSSPMPAQANVRKTWGTGPNDIWTVGDGGQILHYDGAKWTQHESGTTHDLKSLWGTGTGDVFAGGTHGTIVRRRAAN